MKSSLLAAALMLALSAPAFAGQCDDDLTKIDKALGNADLPADQRNQVKDMRNQAADLCKAGNEQEGIDVLSEAKAMLGLD